MISKKQKLTSSDFSALKNIKPKKTFTNIGVFCIYPMSGNFTTANKFAIVPIKKIFKTAILRNRHKRYFYSEVSNLQNKGYFVIFYPKTLFSKEEIKNELLKIVL